MRLLGRIRHLGGPLLEDRVCTSRGAIGHYIDGHGHPSGALWAQQHAEPLLAVRLPPVFAVADQQLFVVRDFLRRQAPPSHPVARIHVHTRDGPHVACAVDVEGLCI